MGGGEKRKRGEISEGKISQKLVRAHSYDEEVKLVKREKDEEVMKAERKCEDKLKRLKQQRVQAATMLIQRWVRGFLARRRVRTLKREAAAVKLQSRVRGFLQVRNYARLRRLVIRVCHFYTFLS